MIKLAVLRRSLCGLMTMSIVASPLAGIPRVAYAAENNNIENCIDLATPEKWADKTRYVLEKFNAGDAAKDESQKLFKQFSGDCKAPNGAIIKMKAQYFYKYDSSSNQDHLQSVTFAPTRTELIAMAKQAQSQTENDSADRRMRESKVKPRLESCQIKARRNYSQLTAEAVAKANNGETLGHPYASSTCVNSAGEVVDFSIDYQVVNNGTGLKGPIISPSAESDIASAPTEVLRKYGYQVDKPSNSDYDRMTTREEKEKGASLTVYVITGVVVAVVVIGGVIIARRAFKSSSSEAELKAAARERRAPHVEAAAAKDAVVAQVNLPKTLSLDKMGVSTKKSKGTIAGGIPRRGIPDEVLIWDPITREYYMAYRGSDGFTYWLMVSNRFDRPYWFPNSPFHNNPWSFDPRFSPYRNQYGGTTRTTGVTHNEGYSGTVRTSERTFNGQAEGSIATRTHRSSSESDAPVTPINPRRTSHADDNPQVASRSAAESVGLSPGSSGTKAAKAEEESGGIFDDLINAATRREEPSTTIAARPHRDTDSGLSNTFGSSADDSSSRIGSRSHNDDSPSFTPSRNDDGPSVSSGSSSVDSSPTPGGFKED